MTVEVSRRRLLQIAAGAAAAWVAAPRRPAPALAGTPASAAARAPAAATPAERSGDPETTTLEAFADTLIPGQKRFAGDHAVAGAVRGPGAVQAGAVELMNYPPAGVRDALPAFAAGLTAEAGAYIAEHRLAVDPALPPLVALRFRDRTELLLELLDPGHPDFAAWYALSAFPFLAFHTAGWLPTAYAVRHHHPGLAMIGFPPPDADGLWRFPVYSYRRRLARPHPRTSAGGSPA